MTRRPKNRLRQTIRSGSPAAEPQEARSLRIPEWAAAAGLLLLVLAVFVAPLWDAGFIWDDDIHITKNPVVVGPKGLLDIWTTSAARICPLTLTSFRGLHALWGLNPLAFHWANILAHAAGALVLWRVLRRLGVPAAWLGAALWALHPVQVETVAWVTELKNTQSGLFYLLAALFFIRSEQTRAPRTDLLLAIGFGLLAAASKSSTVVLPVMLALCAWWLRRRWEWSILLKIVPFVCFALGSAALSMWTQSIEGAHGAEWQRSLAERLADAGKVAWFYLGKLAWPQPLTFIYPRWRTDAAHLLHWLPALAGAGVMVLLWLRRGRPGWRGVFFAAAAFIVALGPVLAILDHYFLRYTLVGDHFQYLACMAPLALAAAGFDRWLRHRALLWSAGALLLSLCAVLSWNECREYRDSKTLWQATLRDNPNAWMAHNNLGLLLRQEGRWDEALRHHRLAIETGSGRAHEPFHDLGTLLVELKQYDEAVALHRQGLALQSSLAGETNMAAAFIAAGRAPEAAPHLERVLAGSPGNATLRFHLANVYHAQGKIDAAIEQFQLALASEPKHADAQLNLGGLLLKKRDFAGAVAAFARVLEIEGETPDVLNNLAWVLATCPDARARDGARAVRLAERACQLTQGTDPRMLRTLAAALAETGRFQEAVKVGQNAARAAGGMGDLREVIYGEVNLYLESRTKSSVMN